MGERHPVEDENHANRSTSKGEAVKVVSLELIKVMPLPEWKKVLMQESRAVC
jgi:hypothetical protein